jgi:hypothetical protein
VRLQGATYQFWVRASTRFGEGESTRVVTIAPSNKGKYNCPQVVNIDVNSYLYVKFEVLTVLSV